MKAHVRWAGDMTMLGYGGTGHGIVMDGGAKSGGLGIGTSPMEMLMLGAGGCACIDIVSILQKARQNIVNVSAEISAERADDHPRVFTKMHLNFVVEGHGIQEDHVKRAVSLSMEKYCSASQTLAKACDLTHSYSIVELG